MQPRLKILFTPDDVPCTPLTNFIWRQIKWLEESTCDMVYSTHRNWPLPFIRYDYGLKYPIPYFADAICNVTCNYPFALCIDGHIEKLDTSFIVPTHFGIKEAYIFVNCSKKSKPVLQAEFICVKDKVGWSELTKFMKPLYNCNSPKRNNLLKDVIS